MKDETQYRHDLKDAKRIVIKVGTRVLVGPSGRPSPKRLAALVKEIAQLRKQGHQIILVTSGAIGAGLQALKRKRRPTNLPDLQMAAAIGQTRLMSLYDQLFRKHGHTTAQILLTHDDLKHRTRHLNARNTIMNLLRHECIPIVNENDVVSIDEIKLGDNDKLASLVSILLEADLLILLTTVNGVLDFQHHKRGKRITHLNHISKNLQQQLKGSNDALSTGGMASKLNAALQTSKIGTPAIIANGTKQNILQHILQGKDIGTLITPRHQDTSLKNHKKRWLAFFQRPTGTLTIDQGAADALRKQRKSLLPIGIKTIQGTFAKGACVEIQAPDKTTIGYGLSDYSSQALQQIKGHPTTDISKILGSKDYNAVIHRDNLVITTSL